MQGTSRSRRAGALSGPSRATTGSWRARRAFSRGMWRRPSAPPNRQGRGGRRAASRQGSTSHHIMSSTGTVGSDTSSKILLNIRAFTDKDASGHGLSCAATVRDFHPGVAGARAGSHSKRMRNARQLNEEGKTYQVLMSPTVAANLLALVGEFASAFSIEAGTSYLVDKLGKKVASEALDLTDLGKGDGCLQARTFDDEGQPTQSTKLIEGGVLKSYLHNLSTAKRFKTKSSGNAGLIEPGPWNLEVGGGDSDYEEMVKEMKRGLVLTSNWYTRFKNYRTGEFSTVPRDGDLPGRVWRGEGADKGDQDKRQPREDVLLDTPALQGEGVGAVVGGRYPHALPVGARGRRDRHQGVRREPSASRLERASKRRCQRRDDSEEEPAEGPLAFHRAGVREAELEADGREEDARVRDKGLKGGEALRGRPRGRLLGAREGRRHRQARGQADRCEDNGRPLPLLGLFRSDPGRGEPPARRLQHRLLRDHHRGRPEGGGRHLQG